MRLPIFASVILFTFIIHHAIRHSRRRGENADKAFWERESRANSTRRQPLDDLDEIEIPLDELPMSAASDDEIVGDCIRQIRMLSEGLPEERIVNLTGLSNTDLKLRYGAANLPYLTSCDDRYTLLVQTLQKWADRLDALGHREESV